MKTVLVIAASFPVLLILVVACNYSESNDNRKPYTNDTSKAEINIVLQNSGAAGEDSDYTKRNINLTHQQWEAFKRTYLLKVDGIGQNAQITGDFNGDGKQESVLIVPPITDTVTKDAFQECIGGCNSYLISSDSATMVLKIHNNLGGEIKNIGDLDGDGADEIMVYPSWWQSNWNPYRIYSMNTATRQWSYLIEPVSIFANELEKNILFVKKATQKGFISAYNTTTDEDGNFHNGYNNFKIIK